MGSVFGFTWDHPPPPVKTGGGEVVAQVSLAGIAIDPQTRQV